MANNKPLRKGSAFRHESHIFFIYDHKKKTEADDPKDAILYFYPRTVETENQIALVGGVIGLTDFCLEFLPQSMPSILKISNYNFALLHKEDYIIGLAGSSEIPDKFLLSHMQFVWSTFVFYQGSVESLRQRVSSENFVHHLNQVWDMYLPLCQSQGEILCQAFQLLPYVQLHKSQGSLFLHASHILQRSLRHKGVVTGALFSRNKILCTQMSNTLTRHLLLLMLQSQFPCVEANSILELPGGVRLLYVFVPKEEFNKLGHRRKKSYSSKNLAKSAEKEAGTATSSKSSSLENISLGKSRSILPDGTDGRNSSSSGIGDIGGVRRRVDDGGGVLITPVSARTSGTDSEIFMDTLSEIIPDMGNLRLSELREVKCKVKEDEDKTPVPENQVSNLDFSLANPRNCLTVSVEVHTLNRSTSEESLQTQEESQRSKSEKTSNTNDVMCRANVSSHLESLNGKSLHNGENVVTGGEEEDVHVSSQHSEIPESSGTGEEKEDHTYHGDLKQGLEPGMENTSTFSDENTQSCQTFDSKFQDCNSAVVKHNSEILVSSVLKNNLQTDPNDSYSHCLDQNNVDESNHIPYECNFTLECPESKNIVPTLYTAQTSNLNHAQDGSDCAIKNSDDSSRKSLAQRKGLRLEINTDNVGPVVDADIHHESSVLIGEEEIRNVKDHCSANVDETSSRNTVQGQKACVSGRQTDSYMNHQNSQDDEMSSVETGNGKKKSKEKSLVNVKKSLVQSNREIDASLDTRNFWNSLEGSSSSELKLDGQELSPEGSILSLANVDIPPLGKDRITFPDGMDSESSELEIMSPLSEISEISPLHESSALINEFPSSLSGSDAVCSDRDRDRGNAKEWQRKFEEGNREGSHEEEESEEKTVWTPQQDGLKEMTLYVQGHSDTLLVLLLAGGTRCSKSYINSLWKSSLSHLAELDFEVKNAERHRKDDTENIVAGYQFMRYDSSTQSLKGSALLPVTSLANEIVDSCVRMHNSFTDMPELQDVTYRSHSACCYGHRTNKSETFFQLGLPRFAGGVCPPNDQSFCLDQTAQKVLYQDAKITLF